MRKLRKRSQITAQVYGAEPKIQLLALGLSRIHVLSESETWMIEVYIFIEHHYVENIELEADLQSWNQDRWEKYQQPQTGR